MSDPKACRVSAVPCHRRPVLLGLAGLLAMGALSPRGRAAASGSIAAEPVPDALRVQNLTDVALPGLDGMPAPLVGPVGRPVLLHFFATWCDVCRDELPRLAALASQPQGPGLYLVSLAEPPGRVRGYMDGLNLQWPVQIDVDRRLSRRLGVVALPTTIVLDPTLRPLSIVHADADWSAPGVVEWLATIAAVPISSNQKSLEPETISP